MSTNANGAQLAAITKELLARWRHTRDQWRDGKAREFEERFVQELEATVKPAITHIEHLGRVLRKIGGDCE